METLERPSLGICGIPLDAEHFDVSGMVGRPAAFRSCFVPKQATDQDPAGTLGCRFASGLGLEEEPVDLFAESDAADEGELPRCGETKELASFQLHPQYCGVLTCFAQFTDLYARDCSQIRTPGFEWLILQNGKPIFPYTRLELIINPWGYNNYQLTIRLDENARVAFLIRNRGVADGQLQSYPIRAFAGRLAGRYWYNQAHGHVFRRERWLGRDAT